MPVMSRGDEPLSVATPPPVLWRSLAPDLDTAEIKSGVLTADIVFFRTALERFRIGVVRAAAHGRERASIRQLAEWSGATLAINANFFDERGRALGLIVTGGSTYQRVHQGGRTLTGVFSVGSDGVRISNRSSYSPTYVSEAVQAGPRLVADGAPVPDLSQSGASSRRSGLCIDQRGRIIFFAVSSGFFGLTLEKLQEIVTLPGIDCIDALNLDGGGSSQLIVTLPDSRGGAEIFLPGQDEVPVALGLFALTGQPRTGPHTR
jgi:uncharacterized protein YigE (DUF2233 family)